MVYGKVASVSILALVAALSLVSYNANLQRLGVHSQHIQCGDFTFRVPPGEYVLNYTLRDSEGATHADYITVQFTVNENSCRTVYGVVFVKGQAIGLPWASPTLLGPYMLPKLEDNVSVNIVPLFYPSWAVFIYYPVNASKVGSAILETPYGALPVDVYEYRVTFQGDRGVRFENATLYYDKSTGLLAGADYLTYIESSNFTLNYTLRLSSLAVTPQGSQLQIKDLPTSLSIASTAGLVGGAALAMAILEAGSSRRRTV